MACTAIAQILATETGRFSDEIRRRSFARSLWLEIMRRAAFPKGMGEVISNLTYERSAPTVAEPTWTAMTVVDGAEGGSCLPPVTKIGMGSTTRTYSLKREALEGPDFCASDLLYPFQLERQLDSLFKVLTDRTIQEWEIHDRHEYFRQVNRKVVVNAAMNETNTQAQVYPAFQPTARLSMGVLNKYKVKLLRDGAGLSAMATTAGAPVLTVIASSETIDALIFDNADIRQDIRWAEPGMLLKPFGQQRNYRGFMFMEDPYPRRFTYSAGVFTEVPAFVSSATTRGNKSDVNPAWETALYEESFIFDPEVMHQLIPEPVVKPHPKFVFNPTNFLGDWQLKNIPDRECNPDENIVYHRGILAAASEPVSPERGAAFVHLRCDPALNLVTACS